MVSIVVIGGGASGFFSAIHAKYFFPDSDVILFEKGKEVLQKVRISGGGRCNVTHACFDTRQLTEFYPRGGKALLSVFQQFQPEDTMQWFSSRGVELKVEDDNRVFPVSDLSQDIVDCLLQEAKSVGVKIQTACGVKSIHRLESGDFSCHFHNAPERVFNRVIMASGGGETRL
ncbi:hypothetical protein DID78_01230 [Candidatus Marinamargulisbacteria bacterium SCGC AG-343-D04]|nr:hypothetical protein DID78_01230 [Candidatus Marinamargulisbacteria bacterium SCGC AG-343-D04]